MQCHRILLNNTQDTTSNIISTPSYKIGYFSKKCLDAKNNEDSLFITTHEDNIFFGVSDGAGGHPKGAEASKIATSLCIDNFENDKNINYHSLFQNVNDEVLALKVGARCTLSVGHINGTIFTTHSAGDSEVIYWNAIGKEVYSNIPQSTIGYKVEAGLLPQGDSLDEPQRNLVSNLIGDEAIRIESTTKMELKKGHTILIGTDGLFDNIPHSELSEFVSKGIFEEGFQKLSTICDIQDENDWKKEDDISFVIIRKVR